jgi:hypothetical protein
LLHSSYFSKNFPNNTYIFTYLGLLMTCFPHEWPYLQSYFSLSGELLIQKASN